MLTIETGLMRDYSAAGLAPIRLYGVTDDGACRCADPECLPKNAGKHPVGLGWQRAPIDPAAVAAHVAAGGNVGLRMGLQPDRQTLLVALDEDEAGSIATAEGRLGALPATLTARTGGGGTHRIFEWPADRPPPKGRVRALAGIDVRAQGGQIVVEPSRTAKGAYSWLDWRAPVLLPAAWCAALAAPVARQAPTPADGPAASGDPIVALVAPTYAQGGRHDLVRALGAWLARQDYLDADIAAIVRALPSDQIPKRMRDALEAAAQARRGEITIGFDCLRERLGTAGAAALEAAVAASPMHRAAAAFAKRLRGEAAAERLAAASATPGGAVFLITPKGRDVFVFDPRIEAYREAARESLVITLRTTGADELVTMCGPRGGTLSPQALLDNGPTAIVREAVTDFGSSAPCLFDREGDRVLLGVVCPELEPRRSEAVATWLEALAGDELAAVRQWIASTRQDCTHRLATALCLVGPHGAGKTVFAQVCARLWGAEPVELGHVAAQFNATMATCPIVLDDECKCLARRTITTEEFRVLIQARARMYEPKGKERRPLLGAQRFILTANDLSDIRFANALGHGAIDALAERITVVSLDDEQAEFARQALDAIRLPSGELDWPALVGHFAWLRESMALPDERTRFLGQGADRARARRAVMAHALDADQAVYERLGAVATGAERAGAVFVAQGALWVKVRAFAAGLAVGGIEERWDLARVQRALEPVRGRRDFLWIEGHAVRAREIDTARLVEVAGLDAATVARTLAA